MKAPRPAKVRIVAVFEFLATIKRKSFLIATFGMPVFLLLYGGMISVVGLLIHSSENEVRVFAVVDEAGVLNLAGEVSQPGIEIPEAIEQALNASGQSSLMQQGLAWMGTSVFRPLPSIEAAVQQLTQGEVKGFFHLPADYLETGRMAEYYSDTPGLEAGDSRRGLRRLMVEHMLEGRVPDELSERVRNPLAEVESWTVTKEGEITPRSAGTVVAGIVVPIAFSMLFFIALMMSANYLIQGLTVEKENKVVEIILSSANPDEILLGKLLGLGGAGLLQVLVWFGMVIFSAFAFAATLTAYGIKVPWTALVAGLFFFPAGYLFLGSLMLGLGSFGSNQRESQQLSAACTLLSVVPLVFMGAFIADPHTTAAQIMTWIPFTAPITVLLRVSLDAAGVAWWEIVGSWLVMLAGTWFALRVGARLFRVGLLMSGARPKLREILRQARLS